MVYHETHEKHEKKVRVKVKEKVGKHLADLCGLL